MNQTFSNSSSNFSENSSLSHLDSQGQAQMVDVSAKDATVRRAIAAGQIRMSLVTLEMIQAGNAPKGDVLGTARLAGIMAAKQTANLIPLCHPLPLQKVEVHITPNFSLPGYDIQAEVKTKAETGVEMEALTAVSVAALTLYDMAKALEKSMQIEGIHLVHKTGGKSGDYQSPPLYTQNPLERFSDRAEDYARYRPSYPPEAIAIILQGLTAQGLVAADVGAGTGIFSHLLAQQGVTVWAIEPNAAMGDAALPHPCIQWQTTTAEETGLPDKSVQLVTCTQSFHWFDPIAALAEFHRILTLSGRIAIIWNDRDLNDPFTQQYSEMIRRASDKQVFDRKDRKSPAALANSSLFVGFRSDRVIHRHVLDQDGLIGLALSSSYIPKSGPAHDQLIQELQALYTRWASLTQQVAIQYTTHVYLAEARSI